MTIWLAQLVQEPMSTANETHEDAETHWLAPLLEDIESMPAI